MLSGYGHLLKIEAPDRVASLIEAHLTAARERRS
jgi:hypothetical protein